MKISSGEGNSCAQLTVGFGDARRDVWSLVLIVAGFGSRVCNLLARSRPSSFLARENREISPASTSPTPSPAMALRELRPKAGSTLWRDLRPTVYSAGPLSNRNASTNALQDLESSSFTVPPPSEDIVKSYDPVARSKGRKGELPPSRYGYHHKAGSYCSWIVALTLSI